jgi:hypothetical protein
MTEQVMAPDPSRAVEKSSTSTAGLDPNNSSSVAGVHATSSTAGLSISMGGPSSAGARTISVGGGASTPAGPRLRSWAGMDQAPPSATGQLNPPSATGTMNSYHDSRSGRMRAPRPTAASTGGTLMQVPAAEEGHSQRGSSPLTYYHLVNASQPGRVDDMSHSGGSSRHTAEYMLLDHGTSPEHTGLLAEIHAPTISERLPPAVAAGATGEDNMPASTAHGNMSSMSPPSPLIESPLVGARQGRYASLENLQKYNQQYLMDGSTQGGQYLDSSTPGAYGRGQDSSGTPPDGVRSPGPSPGPSGRPHSPHSPYLAPPPPAVTENSGPASPLPSPLPRPSARLPSRLSVTSSAFTAPQRQGAMRASVGSLRSENADLFSHSPATQHELSAPQLNKGIAGGNTAGAYTGNTIGPSSASAVLTTTGFYRGRSEGGILLSPPSAHEVAAPAAGLNPTWRQPAQAAQQGYTNQQYPATAVVLGHLQDEFSGEGEERATPKLVSGPRGVTHAGTGGRAGNTLSPAGSSVPPSSPLKRLSDTGAGLDEDDDREGGTGLEGSLRPSASKRPRVVTNLALGLAQGSLGPAAGSLGSVGGSLRSADISLRGATGSLRTGEGSLRSADISLRGASGSLRMGAGSGSTVGGSSHLRIPGSRHSIANSGPTLASLAEASGSGTSAETGPSDATRTDSSRGAPGHSVGQVSATDVRLLPTSALVAGEQQGGEGGSSHAPRMASAPQVSCLQQVLFGWLLGIVQADLPAATAQGHALLQHVGSCVPVIAQYYHMNNPNSANTPSYT